MNRSALAVTIADWKQSPAQDALANAEPAGGLA
jgi:hypothetical protein